MALSINETSAFNTTVPPWAVLAHVTQLVAVVSETLECYKVCLLKRNYTGTKSELHEELLKM